MTIDQMQALDLDVAEDYEDVTALVSFLVISC